MLKRPIILILLVGWIGLIFPILSPFILIGFLLLVCIYIKPILGLYFCITLAPIITPEIIYDSPTTAVPNHYPLSFIPIILSSGIWMIHYLISIDKGENRDFSRYFFPFVLLIWAMIAMLWSLDLYHGVNVIFNLLMSLLLFVLLTNFIHDQYRLEKLLHYLIPLGVLLALITFLSRSIAFSSTLALTKRLSLETSLLTVGEENRIRPGGFATPQMACNVLGFFIFMMMAIYPRVKGQRRRLLVPLAIFLLLNMLLTGTKAGIGGFIAGIFFLIFASPILRKKAILCSFLAITLVVSLYIFNSVFLQEARLTASTKVTTASLTTRLGFWKTGFKLLANRWIGAGTGGFLKVVDPVPGAHSVYFSVLFDLGIVGLTIFALFIVQTVIRLRKAIKECRDKFISWTLYCAGASLIMLLIHSLVDIDYTYNYFWLVTGLVFVVSRIALKSNNQPLLKEAKG